jgi:peptide/nickel transport system substrate-binding protein
MRKTRTIKLLSVILMLAMTVGLFAACTEKETSTTTSTTAAPTTTKATTTTEATTTRFRQDTPLVVGYAAFSEKFSPFFADTGYDNDVASMTAVGLLTTDRTGAIVYNAIEGETIPYGGTNYVYKGIANVEVDYNEATDKTVYTWTIRDDVRFSDGELLTADDIIFTYYTYCDPSYTGSTTLYSVPIVGIKDYRTQTTTEVYDKYNALFDEIYAAGEDHEWAEGDNWTKEQQDSFWAMVKKGLDG